MTDDISMANVFNEYFATVGVPSNHLTPSFLARDVAPINSVDISEQDVIRAITRLKNKITTGPDGFPPLLFKKVKYALMFRHMLSVAFVPEIWKKAFITPIHKKGPCDLVANYRPVSITSVPCKLLERIVVNKMYCHLIENNLLCSEQHGFMRGKSTCTNLLESLNDWTHNVQDGCQTVVIYVDFSKAFDVVQHDKLFIKLQALGIRGTLLDWIRNLFSHNFPN